MLPEVSEAVDNLVGIWKLVMPCRLCRREFVVWCNELHVGLSGKRTYKCIQCSKEATS